MADSDKTIAGSASKLGKQMLESVKEKIGAEWDDLKEKDRKSIERCTKRLAKLSFQKLQGKDVDSDIKVLEAALDNYLYVGSQRVYNAFWETADEFVGLAATFLRELIVGKLR